MVPYIIAKAGTGIGKTNGNWERADLKRIEAAYLERRKESPCGTHTLGKEFAR